MLSTAMYARAIAIGLVVIGSLPAYRIFAQNACSWRDNAAKCSLSLPDGWVMRSQEEIDQINANVRAIASRAPAPEYAAGMTPAVADGRHALIQVMPMPVGASYEDLEQAFGVTLKDRAADVQKLLADVASNIRFGEGVIDRARGRVVIRISMNGPDGEPVEGITYGHLGRRHCAMIHCYAPADAFARSVSEFERISSGVAMDPGAEFVPGAGGGAWVTALRGAAIGALGGLAAYAWQRSKRAKAP